MKKFSIFATVALATAFISFSALAMENREFEEERNYLLSGKRLKEIIEQAQANIEGNDGAFAGIGAYGTGLENYAKILDDETFTAQWKQRAPGWYDMPGHHGNHNNYLRGYWAIDGFIPIDNTPFSLEIDPEW